MPARANDDLTVYLHNIPMESRRNDDEDLYGKKWNQP